jgi:hypothetical protein
VCVAFAAAYDRCILPVVHPEFCLYLDGSYHQSFRQHARRHTRHHQAVEPPGTSWGNLRPTCFTDWQSQSVFAVAACGVILSLCWRVQVIRFWSPPALSALNSEETTRQMEDPAARIAQRKTLAPGFSRQALRQVLGKVCCGWLKQLAGRTFVGAAPVCWQVVHSTWPVVADTAELLQLCLKSSSLLPLSTAAPDTALLATSDADGGNLQTQA